MKNLSTWLLTIFMVIFAAFRVMVTITNQQGSPLGGLVVENLTLEIGLIFLTLVCLVLVVKRKLIGALIYIVSYGLYYGVGLFDTLYGVLMEVEAIAISNSLELLVSAIGVILPLMVLFDTLLDKSRKLNPTDKKTDWFYKNEQFDRKFDERADRNEYKF